MKIVIVRHADPDYSTDSLTQVGRKEAQLLSDRLCRLDVKAFYVSPLGRARDTASFTLNRLGREGEVCQWLREFWPPIHRPDREGLSICWDWLPADWTKEPAFFDYRRWTEPAVMAGVAEAAGEVADGLDAILAKNGYVREGENYRVERPNEDTLLFFCHFGLECVMLGHLLHISPMVLWHGTCAAPASVTILTTEERRKGVAAFRMNTFGDTSHLYVAGQTPSFSARFCEMYDNMDQRHD